MYDVKDALYYIFLIVPYFYLFILLLFFFLYYHSILLFLHSRLGFNLADLFTALVFTFGGNILSYLYYTIPIIYIFFPIYLNILMHSRLGFNLADLYTALVSTFGGTTIFITLSYTVSLAIDFIYFMIIGYIIYILR